MISKLIVFSTLFLAVLFTALYIIRPKFRTRVEQPKYAFLQQLSMYDKSISAEQHGDDNEYEGESHTETADKDSSKDCNQSDSKKSR